MQIFNNGSESLAGLCVLRQANLSCQLKSTWPGKGNLLGASADLVAEWFKTYLWVYFWAFLETSLFEAKQCVKAYCVSSSLCEDSLYISLCKFPLFSYGTDERAGLYARGDQSTCGRGSAGLSLLANQCKTPEIYSVHTHCWEERSVSSGGFSIL